MKTARQWYRFAVQDAADVAELLIYDVIGFDWWTGEGITAKQFVKDLAALPDSITTIKVRVNSPGGDVFEAVAIANALKQHRARIEMSIEGLAASAATIVTCAGDVIRIADNALMMIHNPWSWVIGESKDMRKTADKLDIIRGSILATYCWVSPLSADELSALMDATTWMDAAEAIANGFATETVEGLRAAALLDPAALAKFPAVPDKYRARLRAVLATPAERVAASAAEVLRECAAASCLELAEGLLAGGATLEEVHARMQGARDARAQAEARATEIRGLCAAANLPELADDYIRDAAVSTATIRAQLTKITAKLAGTEIDAGLRPDQQLGAAARPGADINVLDVYRKRNERALEAAKGVAP
jgi:ATP-dependent Clp protease protease subunit